MTCSLRIRVSAYPEKKQDLLTAYPRIRVSSSEIHLEKKQDFLTTYPRIRVSISEI